MLVFEQRTYLVLINVFFCIDGYSCLRYWNEFFSAVFQILDCSFLVSTFTETFAIGFQSDLTTNGLILGFFVGKLLSLTSYLYGLKFAKVAQLLFFFDDIKSFRCLV